MTADSAVLHGVIGTGGVKTEWQFQFGKSPNYSRGTRIQTIPAGKRTVPVSFGVVKLDPGTVYHYRLVAITATASGPHRTFGSDKTFTTKSTGRLLLDRTRLSVRDGRVSVPLSCVSTLSCKGNFRIRTRARLANGTVASVLCASASYSMPAQGRQTAKASVSRACMSLLRARKPHRLIAKLITHPATGQHQLVRTVILVLR